MRSNLRQRMGRAHEDYIADLFGGRRMRGSGNQFNNQGDGSTSRFHRVWAWFWDCKSTLGDSISVSKKTWYKIVEQSTGETPMLPLRFYQDERVETCQTLDLVAIQAVELAAMTARLEELEAGLEERCTPTE